MILLRWRTLADKSVDCVIGFARVDYSRRGDVGMDMYE
jgi:hypothetical protein